jgi:hypothetical protein
MWKRNGGTLLKNLGRAKERGYYDSRTPSCTLSSCPCKKLGSHDLKCTEVGLEDNVSCDAKTKPIDIDLDEITISDRSAKELDEVKQLEVFIRTSRAIVNLRKTLEIMNFMR